MRRSSSNPDPGKKIRQRAERSGRHAETIAGIFLRLKFFSIIEKRLKTPPGEIDIIARRGNLLIFVEVKMRRDKKTMAEALEGINRRRITGAAKYFLAANPQMADKNLRFDVIFLAPLAFPVHLKGAFEAD